MVHINDGSRVLLCHADSILDHGKRPQSQEVHLQQTEFLYCRHRKLCDRRTVHAPAERYELLRRCRTDHDARRMCGRISRQSFQTFGHIDQIMHLLVFHVQFLKFGIHIQSFIYRNV